ncbi:cyclase [Candidatus Planktophila sulfonica]|uniref:Cyclase n=1 Tax=Candidatus Planktophila sulfonica TaxID=1884904 RepID=A0A249KF03_9ACTN|nr:HisA/HisF-related TIM barrel protein [Candidatus Planktophila sulfonica]ASY15357.1 cyclase [Candidatus Planktophila sulfonica]
MIPKRIIARLDVKGEFLVKGIQLEGIRKIGDPLQFAQTYYDAGVDEVVIVDVVASLYSREHLYNLISYITNKLRVPVTVIGGIKTLQEANAVFRSGADKIGINSEATRNIDLLTKISEIYGAQAVVSSIEAKYDKEKSNWFLFTESGRNNSKISINEWFSKIEDIEIGEVFVTSVDSDGLKKGPDVSLMQTARNLTPLPMIYSGGISSLLDAEEALKTGIDGLAIGSALHYKTIEISSLKKHLSDQGFSIRIEENK